MPNLYNMKNNNNVEIYRKLTKVIQTSNIDKIVII